MGLLVWLLFCTHDARVVVFGLWRRLRREGESEHGDAFVLQPRSCCSATASLPASDIGEGEAVRWVIEPAFLLRKDDSQAAAAQSRLKAHALERGEAKHARGGAWAVGVGVDVT